LERLRGHVRTDLAVLGDRLVARQFAFALSMYTAVLSASRMTGIANDSRLRFSCKANTRSRRSTASA
jgi:hypothetical protein